MFNNEIVNNWEFKEAHKQVIAKLSPRSEGLIMFANIPGFFHITSLEYWSNTLLDRGLITLRYAQGLALMRQDDHVTTSHVSKAFEIQSRGIDHDILSLQLQYAPVPSTSVNTTDVVWSSNSTTETKPWTSDL